MRECSYIRGRDTTSDNFIMLQPLSHKWGPKSGRVPMNNDRGATIQQGVRKNIKSITIKFSGARLRLI